MEVYVYNIKGTGVKCLVLIVDEKYEHPFGFLLPRVPKKKVTKNIIKEKLKWGDVFLDISLAEGYIQKYEIV